MNLEMDDYKSILRGMTREELESVFLSQLEAGNRSLAGELQSRYGTIDGAHGLEKMVRRCFNNRCKSAYDVVDDPEGLAWDLANLRKRAISWSGNRADSRRFSLYSAILETIAPGVYNADDEYGILLEVVEDTLGDILDLARRRDTEAACLATIRSWARARLDSPWFRDGSWDYTVAEIYLAAARGTEERDSALALLESRCRVPVCPRDRLDSGRAGKRLSTSFRDERGIDTSQRGGVGKGGSDGYARPS